MGSNGGLIRGLIKVLLGFHGGLMRAKWRSNRDLMGV